MPNNEKPNLTEFAFEALGFVGCIAIIVGVGSLAQIVHY